jgi:hypothetical protein
LYSEDGSSMIPETLVTAYEIIPRHDLEDQTVDGSFFEFKTYDMYTEFFIKDIHDFRFISVSGIIRALWDVQTCLLTRYIKE